MELSGEHRIAAPPAEVWAMLNDPEVLRHCIPGCESLQSGPQGGFLARVRIKIGPVKATFSGAVTISDVVPLVSYRISGEGKGGVAGFASGSADVVLSEEADGTLLCYACSAKVGGKLAQLGSRLVQSTSQKLAAEFFSAFAKQASQVEQKAV